MLIYAKATFQHIYRSDLNLLELLIIVWFASLSWMMMVLWHGQNYNNFYHFPRKKREQAMIIIAYELHFLYVSCLFQRCKIPYWELSTNAKHPKLMHISSNSSNLLSLFFSVATWFGFAKAINSLVCSIMTEISVRFSFRRMKYFWKVFLNGNLSLAVNEY